MVSCSLPIGITVPEPQVGVVAVRNRHRARLAIGAHHATSDLLNSPLASINPHRRQLSFIGMSIVCVCW